MKLCAVLLLVLGLTGLQAQTMYVREISGIQTAYVLTNISKMSFESGNIMVRKTSGNTGTYALANLRYLNFTDLTVGISEMEQATAEVIVFPNPVNDMLNIQLLSTVKTTGVIEILSLEGKVIYKQTINGNANVYQVNISTLPKGMYICRINNGTNIKITKFIKQ